MKHEQTHYYSPPKAEVARSNRAGCTNQINHLVGFDCVHFAAQSVARHSIGISAPNPTPKNEKPRALAGATGAVFVWALIKSKLYQIAASLATFTGVMA